MKQCTENPRRVFVEGVSRGQILREMRMHWRTLSAGAARPQPKQGPYAARIEQSLQEHTTMRRSQRYTVKRILKRLRGVGQGDSRPIPKQTRIRGVAERSRMVNKVTMEKRNEACLQSARVFHST